MLERDGGMWKDYLVNAYCEALGIAVPSVENVAQNRDASCYGLLIAVLLERGGPATLEEAAHRIAAAGVGDARSVLDSLKRCRPGSPPIYRNGDQYALDPHDDRVNLWVCRMGLNPPRSPRAAAPEPVKQDPPPGPEEPLTLGEQGEAWGRYVPSGFPHLRLAISVLDAHRTPMLPADELDRASRVLIYAFPAARPEAVVLIDINQRQIETFVAPQMERVGERLKAYDIIVGLEVRNILQTLGFDPGLRRLAELGATQKSRQINRRGRTLKITTELLIQGSCGISRPFGDKAKTLAYLREGQETKLRRRLEADAKALLAFYQYGRLHGHVRLRWGFLDEVLPAPWVYRDEQGLYDLMRRANESDTPLEVVVGSPPGWEDPWSRARRVRVIKEPGGWRYLLADEDDGYMYEPEVQAARLVEPRDPGRGDVPRHVRGNDGQETTP